MRALQEKLFLADDNWGNETQYYCSKSVEVTKTALLWFLSSLVHSNSSTMVSQIYWIHLIALITCFSFFLPFKDILCFDSCTINGIFSIFLNSSDSLNYKGNEISHTLRCYEDSNMRPLFYKLRPFFIGLDPFGGIFKDLWNCLIKGPFDKPFQF